jgi:diguanylate cyclase (GGDEF)-like protein
MLLTSNIQRAIKEYKTPELIETIEFLEGIKAKIVIPFIDLKLLGFLVISNKDSAEQGYTQDDFVMMHFLCDKIKTTLSNIYANQKANRDGLTGFCVKELMYERLEEEVLLGFKDSRSVSFAMVDLDNFKKVNDTLGHDVGDIFLRTAAEVLRNITRPEDECFRFGGEEFGVIFRHMNKDGAGVLIDRLNANFNQNEMIQDLQQKYKWELTLSIGISTYQSKKSKEERTDAEITKLVEKIVKYADDALLEAKRTGKNRTCLSSDVKL